MKVVPTNFAAGYGALSPTRSGRDLLLAVVGGDLRRHYADVAAAPLPDSLAALVARLADATGESPRD